VIAVTVIALGKLKERSMRELCAEYEKRLSAFCRLLSERPSANEIARALDTEAAHITSKIPANAYVFAMCIEGKQMPSEAFSQKLSFLSVNGVSNVVFLLGSSFGLQEALKKQADFRFSMSEMTFPHQLARVMLLEQIYRAFQIESGGKYHK